MWDLSFLIRDWTCTPWIRMQSLNHWTTKKSQKPGFFKTPFVKHSPQELEMLPLSQIFSSFALWFLTLCDPMDCSLPRLPCPSLSPRACSNSCPLSRWCHPTISSSVVPFSSCLQSFPASGSFQMSQFTSGGQSIGASSSASVLPMNIQDWFPLGLTGLISLQSKGLSRVFSHTTVQNIQFMGPLMDFLLSSLDLNGCFLFLLPLEMVSLFFSCDVAFTICKNTSKTTQGVLSLNGFFYAYNTWF